VKNLLVNVVLSESRNAPAAIEVVKQNVAEVSVVASFEPHAFRIASEKGEYDVEHKASDEKKGCDLVQ
jgi:hypothetical protein